MAAFRGSATSLISLAAGAIAAAAVGAAWVPLSQEAFRGEQESLGQHLEVVAAMGRADLSSRLRRTDLRAEDLPLDAVRAAAKVDHVAIVTPGAQPVAVASVAGATLPRPASREYLERLRGRSEAAAVVRIGSRAEDNRVLQSACTTLPAAQGELALLVVGTGDYGDALSDTRIRATLLFLGLGLVVGLVVVVATRWLLSPVQRMAAAAGRIAQGERGVNVELSGPEEIAQLGRAVNALASSFEEREDEITARLDVVNQLTSMIAHEVRNPLPEPEPLVRPGPHRAGRPGPGAAAGEDRERDPRPRRGRPALPPQQRAAPDLPVPCGRGRGGQARGRHRRVRGVEARCHADGAGPRRPARPRGRLAGPPCRREPPAQRHRVRGSESRGRSRRRSCRAAVRPSSSSKTTGRASPKTSGGGSSRPTTPPRRAARGSGLRSSRRSDAHGGTIRCGTSPLGRALRSRAAPVQP